MIINFLLGIITVGLLIKGHRLWFADPVPSIEDDILAFKAVAQQVQDEQAKKSNEKKKNPIVKSVNINTSNKADLMTIPGIGPVTAERIMIHRQDFGLFQSVEALLEVRGIGPKTFEKIKPFIKTED